MSVNKDHRHTKEKPLHSDPFVWSEMLVRRSARQFHEVGSSTGWEQMDKRPFEQKESAERWIKRKDIMIAKSCSRVRPEKIAKRVKVLEYSEQNNKQIKNK